MLQSCFRRPFRCHTCPRRSGNMADREENMSKVVIVGGGRRECWPACMRLSRGMRFTFWKKRKAWKKTLHYRKGSVQCHERLRCAGTVFGHGEQRKIYVQRFYSYTNQDVMDFLRSPGTLKIERGTVFSGVRSFFGHYQGSGTTPQGGGRACSSADGSAGGAGRKWESKGCGDPGWKNHRGRCGHGGDRRSFLPGHRKHGRRVPLCGRDRPPACGADPLWLPPAREDYVKELQGLSLKIRRSP